MIRPPHDRAWARAGAVFIAYVVLASWGEVLEIGGGPAPWHPAAGLAVAAVFLRGRSMAVPIAAGEVVARVGFGSGTTDVGLGRAVAIALALTAAYTLTGLVARRVGIDARLPDPSNLGRLSVTFVVGSAMSASAVVAIRGSTGPTGGRGLEGTLSWFAADLAGMVLIVPALVLAVSLRRRSDRLVPRPPIRSFGGAVEIAAVLATPAITVGLVHRVDVLGACVGAVALVAVRRAQPGAAIAAALVAAQVTTMLAIADTTTSRADVIALLAALAVTAQTVGLVVDRRFRSTRTHERLQAALAHSDDVVVFASLAGHPIWWNRAAERFVTGGSGGPRAFDDLLHGGTDRHALLVERMRDGQTWRGDLTLVDVAGDELDVSVVAVPDTDDDGTTRGFTVVARDVTEQRRHEAELARHALHDELTGAENRALLVERVGLASHRLRRATSQSALVLIDIDRFRIVNQSLGRDAGDELLEAIAARLRARLRSSDTVARLGDDEFGVVIEHLDDRRAVTTVVDDLLASLHEPFLLADGTVMATASLGVVRLDAADSAEETIRRADLAMYRAKSEGGARAAIYDHRVARTLDRSLHLESSLRTMIDERAVELRYEPVVDLRTGGLVFVNASLRVDDVESVPVDRREIDETATRAGLLAELTIGTVRSAADAAASWPTTVGVVVPLPIQVLHDERFPVSLAEVLDESGLAPGRLVVATSEDAFLVDPTRTTSVLERCRAQGVRVALTGFGAGSSSLAVLRSLPVDILALDQQLLVGLGASPRAKAVAGAALGVAEVLELTVVAEGIENDHELEISRTLGCDLGQGARIAPPGPADALLRWFDPVDR